jgi:predicted GIY-YIG superfamily endonuclease
MNKFRLTAWLVGSVIWLLVYQEKSLIALAFWVMIVAVGWGHSMDRKPAVATAQDTVSPERTRTHSLYRFWTADHVLLYIGRTNRLPTRLNEHNLGKSWWGEVSGVTVQHFDSLAALLNAERVAIQTEHPRENVVHNRTKR